MVIVLKTMAMHASVMKAFASFQSYSTAMKNEILVYRRFQKEDLS